MRSRLAKLLITNAVCTLVLSASCSAANFTADMVGWNGYLQGHKWLGRTHRFRIHVAGGLARMDMPSGKLVIHRGDKGVLWEVFPSYKQYREHRCSHPSVTAGYLMSPFDPELPRHLIRVTKLGRERVNGYLCQKFVLRLHDDHESINMLWYSQALGRTIKCQFSEGRNREILEYKNIREREPDPSLFEVPAGYRKVVRHPEAGQHPRRPAKGQ